ncbi:hypothetical protein [Streptomyces griseoruber]|uniref:hypothetical protein n=1 Tax=Streptomyces griseoruber TaxID=1943 RepID=UPI0006E1A1FF|nr:hypothetical protein [Streptomyces griseoruber]
MAGRPMKPIPDDAPRAIRDFVGALRDFVQAAAGEHGSVTGVAEAGALSRSTFLNALGGQRMPTHGTVLGIVDAVAKYMSLMPGDHKALRREWLGRHREAEVELAAERVSGADPAAATGRAYGARVSMAESAAPDPTVLAEVIGRVLFNGTIQDTLANRPKISPVVFADTLAGYLATNPHLPPAEYPALVVGLLQLLLSGQENERRAPILPPGLNRPPQSPFGPSALAALRIPERREMRQEREEVRRRAEAASTTDAPTVEEATRLLDAALDSLERASEEVTRARTALREAQLRAQIKATFGESNLINPDIQLSLAALRRDVARARQTEDPEHEVPWKSPLIDDEDR